MSSAEYEQWMRNRKRAFYITVWDVQGSPIDPDLKEKVENAILPILKQNRSLAIDVRDG